MVEWIRSNDGNKVLLCCHWSDKFEALFRNIKNLAYGVLGCDENSDIEFIALGDEGGAWPHKLQSTLKPGGCGQLGLVNTSDVSDVAAIGVATNKKNRERALYLSLVLTAGISGKLSADLRTGLEQDDWAPGLSLVYEAARGSCPAGVEANRAEIEDEPAEPTVPTATFGSDCPEPEPALLAIADGPKPVPTRSPTLSTPAKSPATGQHTVSSRRFLQPEPEEEEEEEDNSEVPRCDARQWTRWEQRQAKKAKTLAPTCKSSPTPPTFPPPPAAPPRRVLRVELAASTASASTGELGESSTPSRQHDGCWSTDGGDWQWHRGDGDWSTGQWHREWPVVPVHYTEDGKVLIQAWSTGATGGDWQWRGDGDWSTGDAGGSSGDWSTGKW